VLIYIGVAECKEEKIKAYQSCGVIYVPLPLINQYIFHFAMTGIREKRTTTQKHSTSRIPFKGQAVLATQAIMKTGIGF
jgi:hypothetical protein